MIDSKGYGEDSAETPTSTDPSDGYSSSISGSRPEEAARIKARNVATPEPPPVAITPHQGPDDWDDGTREEPEPIPDTRPHDEQVRGYRIVTRGPGLVRMDAVRAERVEWLWDCRVPLGKVTLVDGDPGLGKSTMTLDLAARVSRGMPMPDGSLGISAAGVVILSAEDGLGDTIRPRLEAHGADLTRIVARTMVVDPEEGPEDHGRLPSLPLDILAIEADGLPGRHRQRPPGPGRPACIGTARGHG